MSDELKKVQDQFESLWFDINGLTHKEWMELMAIARDLIVSGAFNADSFKCTVAAVVLFVSEGRGLRIEDDEVGDWVN